MEANPISVILVKSDSKGDRLLFRFPYATDSRQHGEATQIRRRNPYALTIAEDLLQSQPPQTTNIQHGRLTGFTDEVKVHKCCTMSLCHTLYLFQLVKKI